MQRRALIATALLPLAAVAQPRGAALSAQDRADIGRAEAYLNTIKSLKARFRQESSNGASAGGQAWIERPGKLRFQYDPPAPFLLVANYRILVFRDSQLNQTSNIPLGSTPLGILLRDNLKLSGDITVTNVTRLPGQLQVGLVRSSSQQDGMLTLIFADNPLALRQWIVLDPQRQETRVTLFNVELGGVFDQKLFDVAEPPPGFSPSGG